MICMIVVKSAMLEGMVDMEEKLKFFAKLGEDYCCVYLSEYDWDRMESDKDYGLKAFLYGWAYERAGAPRGWKIAAVKALESDGSSKSVADSFNEYYPPNKRENGEGSENNRNNNPSMSDNISDIDTIKICKSLREGKYKEAFKKMENVAGLGSHKLRAFFLRDLIVMLNVEHVSKTPEDLLFLFPIDVWVETTIKLLPRSCK